MSEVPESQSLIESRGSKLQYERPAWGEFDRSPPEPYPESDWLVSDARVSILGCLLDGYFDDSESVSRRAASAIAQSPLPERLVGLESMACETRAPFPGNMPRRFSCAVWKPGPDEELMSESPRAGIGDMV